MVAGLKSKDKFVYIIRGKNVKGENVKGEMLCNRGEGVKGLHRGKLCKHRLLKGLS